MELRHLRYFTAVADELHFGRAAKKLHIAEPPLSVQIRQLEEELGFKLFERTSRRVALTTAGSTFLLEAKAILLHVSRASDKARRVARGEAGTLKVGLAGWGASDVLAPLVARYTRQFPAVELLLAETTTKMTIEALVSDEIDVGIVSGSVDLDELFLALGDTKTISYAVLRRQAFVVALPQKHPKAKHLSLTIHCLAGEPLAFVSHRACPGIHNHIVHQCEQAGFIPRIVLEHCESQTPLPFIAAGLALAVMPSHYQHVRVRGVVFIPLAESKIQLETRVAWNAKNVSPTGTSFLKLARASAI